MGCTYLSPLLRDKNQCSRVFLRVISHAVQ